MEHMEWFDRTTSGETLRQVAKRADVPLATLSSQTRKGTLKADVIIKVAEAYDESPVIALVDLGFMSSRWITEPGVRTALSRASDEELTDELLRRLNLLDTRPIDQLADDLKNRRLNISNPDVASDPYADGAVPTWDEIAHLPHAADSSPNEQTERENRGEDLID